MASRFKIKFSAYVNISPPQLADWNERALLRKGLEHQLRELGGEKGLWSEDAGDEQEARRLLSVLASIKATRAFVLMSVQLNISMCPEATMDAKWFEIGPGFCDLEQRRETHTDRLLAVRCDRLNPADGWYQATYDLTVVSERLRRFVDEHRLSGLEYLWCIDKGRYAAEQWYVAHSRSFLGRGINHLWFDPIKQEGDYSTHSMYRRGDPEWQVGIRDFELNQMHDILAVENEASAALIHSLQEMKSINAKVVRTHFTLLKDYLPATDFA